MQQNWLWTGVILVLEAISARRDARLKLALAQLEMAKARLAGNRVILTPNERQQLLRLGNELNHDIHDALGLIHVKTYKRWLREQQGAESPSVRASRSRPRKKSGSLIGSHGWADC